MTNNVRLNAEYGLHPDQDYKVLRSNYERYYGRLRHNCDVREERRHQVKSNKHQT